MKLPTRAAIAAALSLGLATAAHAVPLYFDFTGTVTQSTNPDGTGAPVGTAISGGFTFETDRLLGSNPSPSDYSWVDWQPANLVEPLAYLYIGGRRIAMPDGDDSNYLASMSFQDACPPEGCPPQTVESFSLFALSSDHLISADFTGTSRVHSFYFSSMAFVRLADYPFIQGFDYIDGTQLNPISIVSLPLYETFGYYSAQTYDCIAGECTTRDHGDIAFSIDSVSRGIGTRAVPEPGTLGLLVAGLLAALLMRRRTSYQQRA